MANCVNCTDIGADQAINGNRYLCKNCKPKSFGEMLTVTEEDLLKAKENEKY